MTDKEIMKIRADFPLIENSSLVYFDNAATMQRPRRVIERVRQFYEEENANPLRGLYDLSVKATEEVNTAREKVAQFIGAKSKKEIIFTKNATEAVNLATMLAMQKIEPGADIMVSLKSHHSNFLPWVSMPVNPLYDILTPEVKIAAPCFMSNVTGEIFMHQNTLKTLRKRGTIVSADVAQLIAHRELKIREMGVDFAQWSGHKIGAPMGVGVLYVREELLDDLQPVFLGGEMVKRVRGVAGEVLPMEAPQKFEPGTLNVEGILGLGAAVDYYNEHDREKLYQYIDELGDYAKEELKHIPNLQLIGAGHGILAFNLEGIHPHDTAQILAEEGICVRAGYHCAEPFLEEDLKVGPVVRASLSFYNTLAEVDKMVKVLKTARKRMGL